MNCPYEMLQRRRLCDPQVTEYILPCFLTMDSSTPFHTPLENVSSAPGFLQVPGSSVLPAALAFHFLPLSPVSLIGEANADVDARNFSSIFRAQDPQKTFIFVLNMLKGKSEARDDIYPIIPPEN